MAWATPRRRQEIAVPCPSRAAVSIARSVPDLKAVSLKVKPFPRSGSRPQKPARCPKQQVAFL
jgi:hypothetical protein